MPLACGSWNCIRRRQACRQRQRGTRSAGRCSGETQAKTGWKRGPGLLVLLVGRRVVFDDPRAEVLGLPGARCLLDDGDLHESTPFLVNGRLVSYIVAAAVRWARPTIADSNAPL